MYLFFDTETTGLPRSWKAPVEEVDNWPRLVQLAAVMTDEEGTVLAEMDRIVQPDGFVISAKAASIHGIDQDRALREGLPVLEVLGEFVELMERSGTLVAHNLSYDEKVLGAELIRSGISHSLSQRQTICTMQKSTQFCGLPGKYGFKWPTMAELYHKLFEEDFSGAHTAMADTRAVVRSFFELKRRKVL